MKKYRVVTDSYAGFEVQIWRIWFPFWVQASDGYRPVNTFLSKEKAIEFIQKLKSGNKNKVVHIEKG